MTDTETAPTGRARDATRETGRTLASVFTNPNLRRVQLAFVRSSVGDGAYATAVTVLHSLDRDSFLDAVSGYRDAWHAAEDIASRRLAV